MRSPDALEKERPAKIRYPIWPYLLSAAIITMSKLPTLTNNVLFIDEPSYLVEAQRIDSFGAFVFSAQYVSETKLQLGLVPYIAALLLNRGEALLLVHWFGLAALVVSAVLLVAISRLAFNTVIPGIFSSILWAVFLNRDVQTIPTLLEVFQTPFVLLACWFFLRALLSGTMQYGVLALSGLCVGLAALIKPPAVALLPVLLVALVAKGWPYRSVRAAIMALARPSAALLTGLIVPVAIFVVPYLLNPTALAELKFNLVDLTSGYTIQSSEHSLPARILLLLSAFKPHWLILIALLLCVEPIARLLPRFRRASRGEAAGATSAIQGNHCQWLLLACALFLFLAYGIGQVKLHYLIPVVPMVMLVVGYRLLLLYRQLPNLPVRKILVVMFALSMAAFELGTLTNYYQLFSDNGRRYAQEMPDVDVSAVVRYIDSNSGASDRIWVYYNAPEIYWLSNRKPATNEPIGTWLVSYYNPFWFDRTYQQLQAENVQLIIGINHPRYARDQTAGVRALPTVGALLAQHFTCDDKTIPNVVLCKRN